MSMITTTVDQHRATKFAEAIDVLHGHPKRIPEAWHSASIEPDVGMLVEPVNADPYVFLLPNTLHTFQSVPGSGTDRLRQRIEAGIFFRGILARHAAEGRKGDAATALLPSGRGAPAPDRRP